MRKLSGYFCFLYIVSKQYFRYSVIWILLICPKIILAQKTQGSWKVVDANSGIPIVAATVEVENDSKYLFTNEQGLFQLNVPNDGADVRISCLGYNEKRVLIQHVSQTDSVQVVYMKPLNLALEEITVVAENGRGLVTTSRINSTALDHVQPVSLKDVLQLVPGNLIENPDLSKPQQIKIREVSESANSALGTAIIVDGNPLNNDANLQNSSTAQMSSDNVGIQLDGSMKFSSAAGKGVDLRQFSTNNIESVEIIRGVPSVEYGNLTSGAVVVNTKAGASPLKLKFKTDPFIKQMYLGKGMQLKGNAGAINMSIDYLNSFSDVLSKYEGYDRLNAQLGYYSVFFKKSTPLTFNAKVNVFSSLDNKRTDPDALVADEELRSSDKGLNVTVRGNWHLNKKAITGVKYVFAGSVSHQDSYQKRYRSGTQQGISTSMVAGENYGIILPAERLTEYSVDGKPYQWFGQLTAFKDQKVSAKIKNEITLGSDYKLSGNNGLGQIYDIENPPYVRVNSIRPRAYKDIPTLSTLAFYVEDKLDIKLGKTQLEVEGGVRFNNFQPANVVSSNFGFYLEPRGNIRYSVINNDHKNLRHLAVRAGAGKLYKAPPLLFLYPNTAYVDVSSLQYYTSNVDTRAVVYTTSVFDTKNPTLKPMENNKFEVGLDFEIKKIKGAITVFREKSKNGIGFTKHYEFIDYKFYDSSAVPEGEMPDISKLPFTNKSYIAEYRMPVNLKSTLKQGVEYVFDFNKIPAIATQFVVDGAWLSTSSTFNEQPYEDQPGSTNANAYEFVAMYPAGNGRVEERFNSTLRMITHIPKLSLVFTSSIQVVWYEKQYFQYYDKTPLYLFNKTESIPFTEEMKDDPKYRNYVHEYSTEYFIEETFPTLAMLNFRLSKEIGKAIKLSFYANNFLNRRPQYQLKRGGQYIRRNPPVYFGADIQISL